jgi:NADH-quinone oxidoreductase subunit J
MDYYAIIFYFFAALTVGSALFVVFTRNIVHAAFALVFTFLGVAGLYVLLQADFIAVAQVMVYVGGIMVLLVFGVMLTTKATDVDVSTSAWSGIPSTVIVGVFLGTLVLIMTRAGWLSTELSPTIHGTTPEIGEMLLTNYLLPFEVVGLLLLVAIMGAAMIARRKTPGEESAS